MSSALLRGAVLALGLGLGDAAAEPATFRPDEFFEGRTRSTGVLVSRIGSSSRRFTVEGMGRREGRDLRLDQVIRYEDGTEERRRWRIRRLDGTRYASTANDVVGTAQGTSQGQTFSQTFTLARGPGSSVRTVELSQTMVAQSPRRMVNRTRISALGLPVAEATETFERIR